MRPLAAGVEACRAGGQIVLEAAWASSMPGVSGHTVLAGSLEVGSMGVAVGEEHRNLAVGEEHRIVAAPLGVDSMPAVAAEVRRKNGDSQEVEEDGEVGVGACCHVAYTEAAVECREEAVGVEVEASEDSVGASEDCVGAWEELQAQEQSVVSRHALVVLLS